MGLNCNAGIQNRQPTFVCGQSLRQEKGQHVSQHFIIAAKANDVFRLQQFDLLNDESRIVTQIIIERHRIGLRKTASFVDVNVGRIAKVHRIHFLQWDSVDYGF